MDRLARETIVADLRKYGFELQDARRIVRHQVRFRWFRQMMGAVAQYEKSQIVLKLRGARMRKRAKEGRSEGRKPYGFYEANPLR